MLCSTNELGLPDDGVDGLHILPEDAPVGANIREYLDLDDTLFTLKITPNRADCLSVKGIAREVSALTQCAFRPVEIQTAFIGSEKNRLSVLTHRPTAAVLSVALLKMSMRKRLLPIG